MIRLVALVMIVGACGATKPRDEAQSASVIDDAWLMAELEAVHREAGAPALTAAVIFKGQVIAHGTFGVRKAGEATAARADDTFHIGSITKPLTATLVGLFVDQGKLRWDTTLAEAFPELTMDAAYRDVTVRDLLTHTSGMPYKPRTEPGDEYLSISQDITVRRYEYVKSAVADAPEAPPRTQFVYGGGSIIVASMVERIAKRPWEELVREYVAAPLGMTTLRFGGGDVSEHALRDGVVTPMASPGGYASEPHAPAGRNVFMSATDLARLGAAYTPSAPVKLVSEALLDAANAKVPAAEHSVVWGLSGHRFACGPTLGHGGSNGQNWAFLYVDPGRDVSVAVLTNIDTPAAQKAATTVLDDILETLKDSPCAQPAVEAGSLTLGKAAKASDVYNGWVDQYGPAFAVDGKIDETSRWATSDGTTSAWLEVDLGGEVEITRFAVFEAYAPRVESFTIATSPDGTTWTTVHEGQGIGARGAKGSVTPTRARFARLEVRGTNPTIFELALY